ncbi:MAG: TRAP transporter large permease subunit, partial [Desulfobacterales bacterium]|nr:TRAP transporter large permease subunit [Desulfobacterales bacterium]
IIAATCIVLGFGGVALPAYIVVSIFAAPALQKMGISLEQAHFFVMFTTVFAFVTPPIAVAALIASRLAQSNYVETAIEAVKVSVAGFLLPFMFIYVPILLLQPQEPARAVTGILGTVAILLAVQFSFVGYFLTTCSGAERVLWLGVAALLFSFLTVGVYLLFAMGTTFFILLTFWQWRKKVSLRARNPSPEQN